jgi:hypothetical protein
MGKHVRLRRLAREVRWDESDLARWLDRRSPGRRAYHPADFVRPEVAATVRAELCPPPEPEGRDAAAPLLRAFEARGLRRLLVIGGSPAATKQLRELLEPKVELRIVDGEKNRSPDSKRAQADLLWADVVAIWCGTILKHKASQVYTNQRREGEHFVLVQRRGVGSFCAAVAEAVLARPAPR